MRRRLLAGLAAVAVGGLLASHGGIASAGEIVLGQTYDGSRADLVMIARVHKAYFDQINRAGGVHGQSIRLVSLDDRGDSATAGKNLRELRERDGAVALFGMPRVTGEQGTALPQLFVRDRLATNAASGVIGFYPDYQIEGRLIAKHLAGHNPTATVGVLVGNDPASQQLAVGLRRGLAAYPKVRLARAWQVAASASSLEAAMRELKTSDCTLLVVLLPSELVLRALVLAQEMSWKGPRLVSSEGAQALLGAPPGEGAKAAGTESFRYLKDARDPSWATRKPFTFAEWSRWDNDRGVQTLALFVKRHVPAADPKSEPVHYAYSTAQLMVQVLSQSRMPITGESLEKQARRLSGVDMSLLSPGIRVYTHPGRAAPITQGQPVSFDGVAWKEFGDVVDADEE